MQQLDPKAVWLFFISGLISSLWLVFFLSVWGLAFAGVFSKDGNVKVSFTVFEWFWIIVPIIVIFCFVWSKLEYNFYRYELTETGFKKELGIIYKKYVTIPYDRIQNVDIYRGIVARLLGLSDLNIQTAGASAMPTRSGLMGGGSEGRLPGLSKEVAEQLRDELVRRSRQPKGQGL